MLTLVLEIALNVVVAFTYTWRIFISYSIYEVVSEINRYEHDKCRRFDPCDRLLFPIQYLLLSEEMLQDAFRVHGNCLFSMNLSIFCWEMRDLGVNCELFE